MIHGGKMSLRILVADDHKLFRQGLISLMKAHEESVEVVGEAATGSDTVRLTEQLRPDVVLMDIFMPDGDGLEATREITARFPETPVVMLTSSEDDEHLFDAVRLGASGCRRAVQSAEGRHAW
jgi:DNA-binding NarL/FixJ family response regulator